MNIGIIGQGFVGSAIREGLKNFYKISTYDIDETKCNQTHNWVCMDSNIIFVCLPTPMRKDGSCDTRILEKAIEDIEAEIARVKPVIDAVRQQIGGVIVGQKAMVDRLLIGLLCRGHLLIEGVPGLAKTTASHGGASVAPSQEAPTPERTGALCCRLGQAHPPRAPRLQHGSRR